MKNRHLLVVLALGSGLIMALLWLLGDPPAPVTAATVRRPQQEQGNVLTVCLSGDCEHDTIQSAVDAANDGDVVKVATGVYTDLSVRPRDDYTTTGVVTQVVYISKTVSIRGGYATTNWITPDPEANPTTLDAQQKGRGLYVTGDISPTIENLRITGGDADGLEGWYLQNGDAGGGIYAITATITISNCQIYSNASPTWGGGVFLLDSSDATLTGNSILSNTSQGWRGGGIAVIDSSAILRDNVIRSNVAEDDGGGVFLLYADDTVLDGNTIISNTTGEYGVGGGVFCYYTNEAQFSNNIIRNNKSEEAVYTCGGGGMALSDCNAVLDGNIISNNTAPVGGGLGFQFSTITLTNNIISGNTADQAGGGVCAYLYGEATLFNTVIADNRASVGGGVYIQGPSRCHFLHNTLARNAGNEGAGIYVTGNEWSGTHYAGSALLTNTILVSHSVGIQVTGGDTVTVNAVLWDWNTPITVSGAITATVIVQDQYTGDPAFNPDGYHLMSNSAATDKGIDAGVVVDIDGDPRPAPAGTRPDLGADEVNQRRIYLPIALRNL